MKFLPSVLFFLCLNSIAQAQGWRDRAAAAVDSARESSLEQIDRLMEIGQEVPTTLNSVIPSNLGENYRTATDVLGPQVQNLSLWNLVGGSAGELAYAVGRVPGIAWRVARFSCSNEERLEREILCPALAHLNSLNSISERFSKRVALENSDVRSLVNMTLYLLETNQKVIGKCATNQRVNRCLSSGAMQAMYASLSSGSFSSLESYVVGLGSGDAIVDALRCVWPTATNYIETKTAPPSCAASSSR
jgi:hypothetical protein